MPLSDGPPAQLRVGTLPRCPVRSVSGGISADGQRYPGLSRHESGGRGERLRSRLRRASQMGWKEAAVRRRVFVVVGPGPGPAGAAAARFGGRGRRSRTVPPSGQTRPPPTTGPGPCRVARGCGSRTPRPDAADASSGTSGRLPVSGPSDRAFPSSAARCAPAARPG